VCRGSFGEGEESGGGVLREGGARDAERVGDEGVESVMRTSERGWPGGAKKDVLGKGERLGGAEMGVWGMGGGTGGGESVREGQGVTLLFLCMKIRRVM